MIMNLCKQDRIDAWNSLYIGMIDAKTVLERKRVRDLNPFSKMSKFPVDVGSLSPSYTLKSPSFDGKMMEINPK